MKTGDWQGQGFIDQILALIIKELPEYQHSMPLTTHARALYDIELGKQACHPALFKTPEREAYATFSAPAFFTPANRFITTSIASQKYKLGKTVDLNAILSRDQLALALVKGRSYGEVIDKKILENKRHQILRMPVEKNETLFFLITKGRVDGTIAYPFEVNFFNRLNPQAQTLDVLTIAGAEEYAVGHVACPKNQWGEQVIQRVNGALKQLISTEPYKNAMTRWWEEERGKQSFKQFYQQQLVEPVKSATLVRQ